MNLVWFQFPGGSWHAVVPNRGLVWRSLCGRLQGTNPEQAERGAGKSCESCLRIIARRAGE